MAHAPEGWGTSSGLFTDYDGTVGEAWFGTDERNERDPDKVYLFWRMINLRADEEGTEPDEWVERYSIGGGWEVADKGKRVVPLDGSEKKKFNQSTDYGRIINRVTGEKDQAEFREAFEDVLPILAKTDGPRYAATWEGLRFHVAETELSFENSDGETITYSRNYPTAFLGQGGSESGGEAKEEAAPETNGNDKKLRAKLKALAKKSDTHAEFMDAALDIDGVADSDLLDEVADETETGFYAQVNG